VINVGDEIEIVASDKDTTKTTCTGVEMFRKLLDRGEAGDNIGALLRGADREGVERGQILCVKVGHATHQVRLRPISSPRTRVAVTPFFAPSKVLLVQRTSWHREPARGH
jgi:elongation factor Tu